MSKNNRILEILRAALKESGDTYVDFSTSWTELNRFVADVPKVFVNIGQRYIEISDFPSIIIGCDREDIIASITDDCSSLYLKSEDAFFSSDKYPSISDIEQLLTESQSLDGAGAG